MRPCVLLVLGGMLLAACGLDSEGLGTNDPDSGGGIGGVSSVGGSAGTAGASAIGGAAGWAGNAGSAGASGGAAGASAGAAGQAGSAGTTSAGGAAGSNCPLPQTPLLQPCPVECTGGCDAIGTTCIILCDDKDECKSPKPLPACPPGLACLVRCIGDGACENNTVRCPSTYPCTIECNQVNACKQTEFECGDGPCSLSCAGPNGCVDSTLVCGPNRCDLSCSDVDYSHSVNCGVQPCNGCPQQC
jgi:hypothetical protein